MRRYFVPFVFGLLVIWAMAITGCSRSSDARTAATGNWAVDRAETEVMSTAVEAVEVRPASILQRVSAAGIVQGNTEVTVVSEAQGAIVAVSFDLGDFVAEGAVLARVDDTIARLSLEEARQQYESAQLDLAAAERRAQAGGASQAEVSRARSVANGAKARLEAAEKNVRDHTVRSPIAGYIATKSNDLVRGNFMQRGAVVARVVDLETLRMTVSVGEQELQYLREGDAARVTIPACGVEAIPARVRAIAAGADTRTGSFAVVITWTNSCAETVRSGVSASVEIDPRTANTQLIVPLGAVMGLGTERFVFVVQADSTVARRPVQLGRRLGDRVEVLRGLTAGEVVAISALPTLRDGAAVTATVIGRTDEVL